MRCACHSARAGLLCCARVFGGRVVRCSSERFRRTRAETVGLEIESSCPEKGRSGSGAVSRELNASCACHPTACGPWLLGVLVGHSTSDEGWYSRGGEPGSMRCVFVSRSLACHVHMISLLRNMSQPSGKMMPCVMKSGHRETHGTVESVPAGRLERQA